MLRPTILFISHESSRSGAPLLLSQLIHWLKKNDFCNPIILVKKKGVLDNTFKVLGPVLYNYEKIDTRGRSIFYKIYGRIWNSAFGKEVKKQHLLFQLKKFKITLIYSNTISNGEVLEFLQRLKVPVITHVHESYNMITSFGATNVKQVKDRTNKYIACSKHVARVLSDSFDIDSRLIDVVYSSINSNYGMNAGSTGVVPVNNKNKVIGGAGAIGWLKGTDLIVPLMQQIHKFDKDVLFFWIGGDANSKEFKKLIREIDEAGLSKSITVTGSIPSPDSYFSMLEIFVLLSREDSFPLVCLENGILGKPVLCFDKSGGVVELLSDLPGNIIPEGDVDKMANKILQLLDDNNLKEQLGAALKNTILRCFTSEVSFPEIHKIIQRFSSTSSSCNL